MTVVLRSCCAVNCLLWFVQAGVKVITLIQHRLLLSSGAIGLRVNSSAVCLWCASQTDRSESLRIYTVLIRPGQVAQYLYVDECCIQRQIKGALGQALRMVSLVIMGCSRLMTNNTG